MKTSGNLFQKEKVKRRLLRNAAELWGYQETDLESFDPMVDLLFGACATEFEKTDKEIQSSHTRILKRLAHILLPEILTTPTPAHAIMHARSVEPLCQLSVTDQFYTGKEILNPQNPGSPQNKDIFFSPASTFQLVNGDIEWIATGQRISKISNVITQEEEISSMNENTLDTHTLWLGIDLDAEIKTLEHISIFFDWKNRFEKENYIKLLPLTQWFVNGVPLTAHTGYPETRSLTLSALLDASQILEQRVLQTYQASFVTIHLPLSVRKEALPYPEVFAQVFAQEALEQLQKPLLWLEVRLPYAIPADAVADTLCAMNCFPVLNRKLENSNRPYRVSQRFNMIPLATEDYFLSAHQIDDDHGKHYHAAPFQGFGEMEPGTFTIRQEGVGRFDHRNALELLSYLLDLMRDEKAAFESLGGNKLLQEIKAMKQNLSRLENMVETTTTTQDIVHYLLLHVEKEEAIWVAFWSTTGILANKIPAGTKLQILNSADYQQKGVLLVTTAAGGRNKPSDTEQVYRYRSALLSRDRLVTIEDIKAACFAKIGDLVNDITIRKGVSIASPPNSALERTIDILIHPNMNKQLSEQEWENIRKELKQFLQQKSSFMLNIQVFINHQ